MQPAAAYVIYGVASAFTRGDADFAGGVNITDAIAILNHLFLGGSPVRCADAGDSTDDGVLDITDAVYLLRHLFLGETPPPRPYPAPGNDPTEDGLRCPADF